jgi:hypothetical protein
MAQLHQQLARQIPKQADAILFVGMAETATGLGHGVFEAYLAASSGPALFLQTTRYPLGGARPLEFQEEHSHAIQQYLYLPETLEHLEIMARATSVVLIDDEATSGKTILNLAHALRAACPNLTSVHPVMLTDFTRGELDSRLLEVPGIECAKSISLWKGAYRFSRDPLFHSEPAEPAFAPVACRRSHISAYTGRFGVSAAIELPASLIERCQQLIGRSDVLVVGTGECMHPAFCLALALEQQGHQVAVQSTTRSPLMVAGAIDDALRVTDPYGEGIPNFIYNTSRSPSAKVVVVHESRERECVGELLRQLDAIEVSLCDLQITPSPPAGCN